MEVNHKANYRRALPLGLIFALASITSAVFFVVYATKWSHDHGSYFSGGARPVEAAYYDQTVFEYSYYATVISLLFLIVFFNGYHLTKMAK